jgi:galactose mutarotase-like enzyme
MAEKKSEHGFTTYTITSKDASTSMTLLPERGGFGSSLIMPTKNGPREMLHQHEFFWEKQWNNFPGGWPFLFPICARIGRDGKKGTYLYDGKQYELPIHGFSWHSEWSVIDETDSSLTMHLQANDQTMSMYPFNFEVKLRYVVEKGLLTCYQTYTNRGDTPMPYYAGFHPYLAMPEAGKGKDEVMLDYKPVRRFKYNEAMTDIIGEQPLFELPTSITNPEILEQLTYLGEDKEVRLTLPNGLTIHIDAQGNEGRDLFSYLQLYTIEDKPFFCAEHWMSFPNALNTVKGVRWLKPGESEGAFLKLWTSET